MAKRGLARAAGTGERQQARAFEHPAELGQFPVAADEARRQRGEIVPTRPRIGGATDEQPAVHGSGLGRRRNAERLGEPVPQALEGRRRVPAPPGRRQRDEQGPVHVLVERPLRRQRLQQRERLGRAPVGHQRTGQVADQAGSDRVQPVAVRRRPVLIEVLGQELTRPQGERVGVGPRAHRSRPPSRPRHRTRRRRRSRPARPEHDDLVVEHEVLGAEHPPRRMQRLMEVVRTDRWSASGHNCSISTSRWTR